MNIRRYILLFFAITLALSGCATHYEAVRIPEAAPLYSHTVMFDEVQYVPLLRFCDYYKLDWDWDLVSQRIAIKRSGDVLVLRPNSSFALFNNKTVELENPVRYKDGGVYIPVETTIFLSEELFAVKEPERGKGKWHRIKTVVIDPGHGGKDPGAVSRYGTKEKHIVLDISKRLKRQLERNGLTVYLTREKDIFIPLYKRASFANGKKANLFISVHANAARRSRAKGFEVFYLSEATDDNARALAAVENKALEFEEASAGGTRGSLSPNQTVYDLMLSENRRVSKELAYYIYNITSDEMGMKKRGVKGARFAVLKGALMPAVLVEVGFLTNRREESKLKTSSFRNRIANAITDSIMKYKKEYDRTGGFSQ